jgi:glycosyltransferase involved in cell wall biosynthesis
MKVKDLEMTRQHIKIIHIMPQLHLPGHHSSFSYNVIKQLELKGVVNEGLHNGINDDQNWSKYKLKHDLLSSYIMFSGHVKILNYFIELLSNIEVKNSTLKLLIKILKYAIDYTKNSIDAFLFFFAIKRNGNYNKYDIIFIHDFWRNIGLSFSSLFGMIPKNTLMDIHVYTTGHTVLPTGINLLNKFFYHTMLNKINIIFHSKGLLEFYRDTVGLDPGKLFFVPYGLADNCEKIDKQTALQNLELPAGKKIILFIGTMRPDKGLDLVIKSLEKMDKSKYFFLLVGSMTNLYASDMDSSIHSIGWDDSYKRISLEQYSSYTDYQDYFSSADVLILPYKKTFIGASATLGNAAEFGLPVIGPQHGQIGEFIQMFNLGLTFESENPDSFIETIERFFELNEKEIASFQAGLSEMVVKQNWSKVANKLIEISEIVNGDIQ